MDIKQLWREYSDQLRQFLQSRMHDSSEVDDLLQEISIKTSSGMSSLQDNDKIQQWLFQTAHRTIIDFYRKNGRDRDLSADDLWYRQDDPDTLQSLERCVEPFIAALPADTAHLLTAIDIEGQSQKNYAAENGMSYSTLKSRVKSGRDELRRVFDACCQMNLDAQGNIIDYQPKSDHCKNC